MSIAVTYWSTRPMNEWTPSADKPLSFSLTASTGAGEQAYLSAARVDVALVSASGSAVKDDLAPFSDKAEASPGYLMTSPQSYSSTIVIPALPATAASIDAVVTFSIIEQGSASGEVKQTATDRLVITLR